MKDKLRNLPFGDLYRYARELSLLIRPAFKTKREFSFIGIKKMAENTFEPDVCALIDKQFALGTRSFIDVGAHHGFFTILAASKGMQVTAFEPDPINFRVLKRNIKLNRLDNVKAFNFGIGDKEEELTFFGFSTGVSIEPSWGGNVSKRKFVVQVKKLDDILNSEGNFDRSTVMKIDVEGFEENVVSGAEEFIRNSRNLLLIIEITFTRNQSYSREYRDQALNLIKKLIQWGYEPMQISPDGSLAPARKSILDSLTESQSISISGNFAFQRST